MAPLIDVEKDWNGGGVSVDLNSVRKAYSRYSGIYDFVFGAVFHPGRKSAVEHLHCQPGDHVLEVGVGTGLSLPLYRADVTVTGIDLSEGMLKRAQKKVEEEKIQNVQSLHVMDAQNMTFDDNSFDRVVAMYVASVVPEPKKLVSEIQRVCRPGGTIIFLNHFESGNQLLKRVEGLLKPFSKAIGFHPDINLDHFLEETGLQPDQIVPANLFGYWTLLIGHNQK